MSRILQFKIGLQTGGTFAKLFDFESGKHGIGFIKEVRVLQIIEFL